MVDKKTEDYIVGKLCEAFQPPKTTFSHPDLRKDLDLELLVENAFGSKFPKYVFDVLCSASTDKETVLKRQDFVRFLIQNESNKTSLEKIAETSYKIITAMIERDKVKKSYYGNPHQGFDADASYIDHNTMRAQILLKNIAIMENYARTIEAFSGLGESTEVYKRLSSFASEITNTEEFIELASCVCAFLNNQYILLGVKLDAASGIRELKYISVWGGKEELPVEAILKKEGWRPIQVSLTKLIGGSAVLIYEAINKILEKNFNQIMEATLLIGELDYYLSAANFYKKMQEAGVSICFPKILEKEKRTSKIKAMQHPVLLYQENTNIKSGAEIVPSDIQYEQDNHIFVITGPNNGGKSIHVKTAGLVQLLGQNGFPVPSVEAEISIVDGIYTHSVKGGDIKKGQGRHSDDCRRLRKIFELITPYSLAILDDLYGGGTSSLEAKEEALIQFEFFNRIGAVVLLTTHVHEISLEAEKIPYVTNLHIEVFEEEGNIVYSRRLLPGRAVQSYGRLVAEQEGVGEKGLKYLIEKRVKEGTLPASVLK